MKPCDWEFEPSSDTIFLSEIVKEFSDTDTIPDLLKKAFKKDM